MSRVSLSRLPDEHVLVVDDGAERVIPLAGLPGLRARAGGGGAPLGLGRHRALVSPAARRRRAGRAGTRPAPRPPAAAAGTRRGRPAARRGRGGPLGPARTGRGSDAPHAVQRRRHRRAPACRRRGRPPARGGRRLAGGRAARPAGGGGVRRRARRGRDDVRRRAVAHRRPRAPARRPAGPPADAGRAPASAGRAGRRGPSGLRRPDPQPRLAPRPDGRAAPGGLRGARRARVDAGCGGPPRHRAAAALQEARPPLPDQRLGVARRVGQRRTVPRRPTSRPARRRVAGRPTAAVRCRSRRRCAPQPWPTRAGCWSSPTSRSSSPACSRG